MVDKVGGDVDPPHTRPWPNPLSPIESQITKNASLQKHDQTPTLSKFQTYPLSHHQKTQPPRRPPKAESGPYEVLCQNYVLQACG